jgi:hypothetical protein
MLRDPHAATHSTGRLSIHAAVMQIAPEKLPRPDGFIGAFYKACWPIVKEGII